MLLKTCFAIITQLMVLMQFQQSVSIRAYPAAIIFYFLFPFNSVCEILICDFHYNFLVSFFFVLLPYYIKSCCITYPVVYFCNHLIIFKEFCFCLLQMLYKFHETLSSTIFYFKIFSLKSQAFPEKIFSSY